MEFGSIQDINMKIIVMLLILLSLSGCKYKEKNDFNKIISNEVNENKETIDEYQDNNPVIISMYADNTQGQTQKVNEVLTIPWIVKKDITILSTFYTDDEYISGSYYQTIWNKYASRYDEYEKYKTGWEISFDIENETIHRKVLKPSDVADFYDYLEIYLYDSVHQELGAWYSHLLESEINDKTILTTMKLTCGSKCEKITSDINVKAYTYDDETDFDKNGFYRGNSFDNIVIKRK